MSDLFGNHIVGFSTRWLICIIVYILNFHSEHCFIRFEKAHLIHFLQESVYKGLLYLPYSISRGSDIKSNQIKNKILYLAYFYVFPFSSVQQI